MGPLLVPWCLGEAVTAAGETREHWGSWLHHEQVPYERHPPLVFNVYRSSLRSLEILPRPAAVSRKFRGFESTSSAYDAGLLAAAGCGNQARPNDLRELHAPLYITSDGYPATKRASAMEDRRRGHSPRNLAAQHPLPGIPNPKSRTLRRIVMAHACHGADGLQICAVEVNCGGQDRKRVALECAWES